MSSLNPKHISTVKNHVHFLLTGLPQLNEPISYSELATALRELASDYDAISASQNETKIAA